MKRRLRLGMIGGGRGAFIGAVHRMAARLDDRYEFVAGVMSSDPERARASGAELFLAADRCYGTLDEMVRAESLRKDPVDVVAIVTPNQQHYSPAGSFLKAGFHVICDKPLTTTVADAEDLVASAERAERVLAVTYNYSGYPMVGQAKEMIADGELGELRTVQVEYPQDWLTRALEGEGNKQAMWRTDPESAGGAGVVGDIGTHAFHLTEFVAGIRVSEIAAELTTHVARRGLDDNAQMLLRFDNGARGGFWASQIAPGNENGLRLRIFGERGGLEWFHGSPDTLQFTRFGGPRQIITRGSASAGTTAALATRIPAGHPEGYIEAFAQIYRDAADLISAVNDKSVPSAEARLVPTGLEGVRGVRFVLAAVESSRRDAAWVNV